MKPKIARTTNQALNQMKNSKPGQTIVFDETTKEESLSDKIGWVEPTILLHDEDVKPKNGVAVIDVSNVKESIKKLLKKKRYGSGKWGGGDVILVSDLDEEMGEKLI